VTSIEAVSDAGGNPAISLTWRARRVAWHQFTRRHRRPLVLTEAAAVVVVAAAIPLYLSVAGYQWRAGGGATVRELPSNIDSVQAWALWVACVGSSVAAIVTVMLVLIRMTSQWNTDPARWRRVPSAALAMALAGSLWALSSLLTTGVIVNGLVMT
jgi:hypothetical protein